MRLTGSGTDTDLIKQIGYKLWPIHTAVYSFFVSHYKIQYFRYLLHSTADSVFSATAMLPYIKVILMNSTQWGIQFDLWMEVGEWEFESERIIIGGEKVK